MSSTCSHSSKDHNGVKAIHLDCKNKSLYISWGGHTFQSSSDPRGIEISRKFGELQGLVEGQEVIATALESVKSCSRVTFYPASQSDYEIAEVNARLIESVLINQLRIVWEGVKIPVWIQKNNCIVLTVGEIHPRKLCSQIEEFTEVHLIPWKEVETRKSSKPNEGNGLDIPIPPALAASLRSPDSERSGESSARSSESSSLNNSTSSNATATESSSLKSSTNSGVHTIVSETPSLNASSGSGVDTDTTKVSTLKSNNSNNKEVLPRYKSTGNINRNNPGSFSALKLARSLNQAGDKYEQSHTPNFLVDIRNRPLTAARIGVGHVGAISDIFKTMLLGPHSADGENFRKFRTYPTSSKPPGSVTDVTNSSVSTTKKSSITAPPEVPLAQYYRVQNLDVCNDIMTNSSGVESLPHNLLQQPSTIFVYSPDVACITNRMSNKKLRTHGTVVNDKYVVKTASIHKLYSMKEKADTSPAKTGSSNDNTPNEDFKDSDPVKLFERKRLESSMNSKQRNVSSDERGGLSSLPATIVRLVLTSQRNFSVNEQSSLIFNEDLLSGHVAVNCLIRRQLKLGLKSAVQINKVHHKASDLLGLVLNPFGDSARKVKTFTNSEITIAFTSWILETTREYPLILASRMLIEFNLKPEIKCEFLLSGIGSDSPPTSTTRKKMQYFEISERTLNKASVTIGEAIQPSYYLLLSPYPAKNTKTLDKEFSKSPITCLGGFDKLYETCVDFLLHGLACQPLSQQLSCSNKPNCNTLLIYGSGSTAGGSGKTSLAHAVCNTLGKHPILAHVSVIECVSLRGKRVETIRKSWQQTFNNAAWHEPAVILFDDLDQLISAPSLLQENGPEAHYSLRLAQVFKTFLRKEIMCNSNVVVIATATSRDSVHPALRTSHGNHVFCMSVEIPLPSLDQRADIIYTILKTKDLSFINEDLRKIAVKTEGCSPKDLQTLVARAQQSSALRQSCSQQESVLMSLDDFNNALECFKPASLHGIKLHQGSDLTWQDVGGLDDIKQTLKETLEWPAKYPELYNSVSMRLPSGILLYGPPGCGKTMLAGVVAKECSLNFISIKGPELLNKYIGASEQAVRDLFHRAQSAKPCILFFDEFDSMAPRRGHDSTGVTDRVVNQLLTQLDGVEGLEGVYILGATSRPDLIDPALLRPGRLDKSLYCGMPDEFARLEILQALSSKLDIDTDVDLKAIAKETENFSGADLKALLSNAQLERIHKMKSAISDKPVKVEIKSTNIVSIPQLKRGAKPIPADENSDLEKQVAVLQDNFFKHVYGKANHSPKPLFSENIRVKHADIDKALSNMAPSVTPEERLRYASIYQSFKSSAKPAAERKPQVIKQRATLA